MGLNAKSCVLDNPMMSVLNDNTTSDSSVLPSTDNITFLEESTCSVTSPSTLLTNLVRSSVASANGTSTWGPVRDPLYIVVPITVIYVVILLTGLVGNVSTCVVIARNKHMHTATNYYLFSLAVSNLLLLVTGLPQEIYCIWSRYPYVFGEAFCVLQRFAAETSANATVLTITAFTVERYVAICHPFQSHTLSKLSRAVHLILVIWVLALGLAVPQALQFGVVYKELPDGLVLTDHTVCAMKRVVIPHSFVISTVVFFVAPMTLISVLYALIGLQLRRERISLRRNTEVGGYRHTLADRLKYAQIKSKKRLVKMLVAVVVTFFICWAPFHVQRLLAVYGAGSSDDHTSTVMGTVFHKLTYISGVLYYLSTTVNPVLYLIKCYPFRKAFMETLALVGRCRCCRVLLARHSNTSNWATGSIVFSFQRRRTVQQDSSGDYEVPVASLSTRPDFYISMEELTMDRSPCTVQQDSSGDYEVPVASLSTRPDIYISMEELTMDRSPFNSRKTSKLDKTGNKQNETHISVISSHYEPTSRDVRGKWGKEGNEKEDRYAGLSSSSNSSFTGTLKHENQAESLEVPAW